MLPAGDSRTESNTGVDLVYLLPLSNPSPSQTRVVDDSSNSPHFGSVNLCLCCSKPAKVIAEMRAKAQGAQIPLLRPSGFRLGLCSRPALEPKSPSTARLGHLSAQVSTEDAPTSGSTDATGDTAKLASTRVAAFPPFKKPGLDYGFIGLGTKTHWAPR